MKVVFFVVLFFWTADLVAQDSSRVIVHKDPRLDALVQKQIESNEYTLRHTRKMIQGYRILAISTNNRGKALDAKTSLFKEFPELKSYLLFQSPYYRLKVGNFKEREDAEFYLQDVQRIMNGPVYIVRDIIEATGEDLLDM